MEMISDVGAVASCCSRPGNDRSEAVCKWRQDGLLTVNLLILLARMFQLGAGTQFSFLSFRKAAAESRPVVSAQQIPLLSSFVIVMPWGKYVAFSSPDIRYEVVAGQSLGSDKHCYHVEEWDGSKLLRTFTALICLTQKASHRAERDIKKWCELHPEKLPRSGGSLEINLDEIQIQ
jgi:hypothetical protein